MTFHSYEYLALLLGLVCIYWLLPRVGQNIFLLAASYAFYSYIDPTLGLLLFGYTSVNYFAALGIAKYPAQKRKLLVAALLTSIGVLSYFKYLGFLVENVSYILTNIGLQINPLTLNIFLPVGISFYTFQTLGYVIDVYKGRIEARSNFWNVALYVAFFPQLVAGPIERAARLIPQFEVRRRVDTGALNEGVYLLIWGFFKKMVVADSVAVITNKIFMLDSPSIGLLTVGVLAFGVQILADFSGYTDIARGSARLLGIRLVENFDNPYFARSPRDFWHRWHISLSSWFRDYVYIPLGGAKGGRWKSSAVLLGTFLITGLWHGAAWNFVIWGGYHGLLLVASRGLACSSMINYMADSTFFRLGAVGVTFVLVHMGWFLFRADDLSILWDSVSAQTLGTAVGSVSVTMFLFFQVALYSLPLWIAAVYRAARGCDWYTDVIGRTFVNIPIKTGIAMALFVAILMLRSQVNVDFIYFQF